MTSLLRRYWSENKGQDIAEYAVMMAVLLVLTVGTVLLIGTSSTNVFSSISSKVGS